MGTPLIFILYACCPYGHHERFFGAHFCSLVRIRQYGLIKSIYQTLSLFLCRCLFRLSAYLSERSSYFHNIRNHSLNCSLPSYVQGNSGFSSLDHSLSFLFDSMFQICLKFYMRIYRIKIVISAIFEMVSTLSFRNKIIVGKDLRIGAYRNILLLNLSKLLYARISDMIQ